MHPPGATAVQPAAGAQGNAEPGASTPAESLSRRLEEVQRFLVHWLSDWHAREAQWAFAPAEMEAAILARRGKLIRPRLMLAMHAACGGVFGPAIRATAAALELFHGTSLIYDDIQDNARMRRGMPAHHTTRGVSTALSLCALLSRHVNRMLLDEPEIPDDLRVWLYRRFTAAQIGAALGQMADTGWVRDERFDLAEDDYWRMLQNKTAALFAYAAEAGAGLATGGNESATAACREFGERLGLLFQLVDDHADLFLPDTDGKPRWQDVREAKRTLYLLHARRESSAEERAEFDRRCLLPVRSEEDVAWLVERIRAAGGEEIGRAHIQRLFREADEALTRLGAGRSLDAAYVAELRRMLESVSRGIA